MTTAYDLIPCPRELTEREGVFPCGSAPCAVCLRGVTEEDAGRLLAAARQVIPALERVEDAGSALILELDPALAFPAAARPDVLDQGYALEVALGGIRARARSARGLYHALRTLGQLPRSERGIPACAIRDWPDLPFRALHIPGFGNLPRFDELLALVEVLAGQKYNALVLEYDDRFSFERYPVLNHPDALTKDQVRALIAFAADRFLEIVPCLDSLGHANFYLKHKDFQHLAELPGNIWELCPSNPETLRFIRSLWEEVLEVHRGARFASITGDEVFREGGFCPACAPYAKAGRLSRLYTTYYGELSRWVLAQGVRPMMWGDMILAQPEDIQRLPREIVFADWNYSSGPAARGERLYVWGAGEFRPGQEHLIPERYARVFGKYFKGTDGRTPFEPFPYLRYFMDQGFAVLATTSVTGGFRGPIANNRLFCRAARKAGAFGLLNTTWEGYLPIPNALHGIAAGAAYAWKADESDEDAFLERFARRTLGPGSALPRAARALDRANAVPAGFELEPPPDVPGILLDASRALRAGAGTAPGPYGGAYAELTALRLDVARREAVLRECTGLLARFTLAAGDDRPLDLSAALNFDGVMPKRSGLFEPPSGRHLIHGIPFELADPAARDGRRAICVGGRASFMGATHGQPVRIPVGRACDALFFLVAGAWGKPGATDGVLRMKFEDGAIDDLPLVVEQNLRDWSYGMRARPRGVLEGGLLAWVGAKGVDGRFGLYLCPWRNPRPEAPVAAVEMRPLDKEPGFAMVFAVTARSAGTTRPAPDFEQLRSRAVILLGSMETMATETGDLGSRHRTLYERLLAPEDVGRLMKGLTIPDMGPAIAALRAAAGVSPSLNS